jgi:hypothetical protein
MCRKQAAPFYNVLSKNGAALCTHWVRGAKHRTNFAREYAERVQS